MSNETNYYLPTIGGVGSDNTTMLPLKNNPTESTGNVGNIRVTTWANRGNAADHVGEQAFFSDLGVMGYSNGVNWIVPEILLKKSSSRYIVASLEAANTSTYTQSGSTLIVTNGGGTPVAHNIPNTANGSSVYLAISTGAAVAGWFTNFTYVDANTFMCTSAVSQTTSGIVNSNVSQTIITPESFTVPAELTTVTSEFETYAAHSNNNSAGTKTVRLTIAGSNFISKQTTTTIFGETGITIMSNKNNLSSQYVGSTGTTLSVNTANSFIISPTIQIGSANDYAVLETWYAKLRV